MRNDSRGRIRVDVGMGEFLGWLGRLFRQPVFLFVTVWGHVSILSGAWAFRFFEAPHNPKVTSFFDAYYWAISMSMTVGSSDIFPVTSEGKWIAIALMVIGCLFLWSYAALFAASVMLPTVRRVGAEVEEVEREVKIDQATLEALLRQVEELNRRMDREHSP